MTKPKSPFSNDRYKKVRGGYSRLLDIGCATCGAHICNYQKDGPGTLKRMYLDRISGLNFEGLHSQQLREIPQLICKVCKHHLGTPMIYEKEDRLAYRLFVGAVSKRIVKEK
jgi:hypothetical protein